MATPYNVFRILADLSHALSKVILMVSFVRNSSAEGVSLLTQLLYVLVFVTRYIDLLWSSVKHTPWNFVFKTMYIASSLFIVLLMMKVYPRTREKEGAWKLAGWASLGCLISAPVISLIDIRRFDLIEMLWTFSIELEAFAVLPQLLLLRQTSVPTVLDSYYLVALGSYRFLYVLNWIWRGAIKGQAIPTTSIIFGVIQTLFYVDFAYVYYGRQRVKLRSGTVVDSDDLSKSFLVRRLIGTRQQNAEDDLDEENAAWTGADGAGIHRGTRSWGVRGISVSADDTLQQHDKQQKESRLHIADPAQFEDSEDDEDDDNHGSSAAAIPPQPPAKDEKQTEGIASSAHEWSKSTH